LRVHHLLDVDVDLLARPGLQLVLELLDLGPLPPDDDARPSGVDGDPGPVGRALDIDARDAGVVEGVLDVPPDLRILVEEARVLLGGEPPGAPRPRRAQPEPDRVGLLSHAVLLLRALRRAGRATRPGPARSGSATLGPRPTPGAGGARPPAGRGPRRLREGHRDVAQAVADPERPAHRAGLNALEARSPIHHG